MAQSETMLPALRTLAMLPLRDADMLLHAAERMYGTQSAIEARQALRRIDTYRRLLGLPRSIGAMERAAIKSARRDEAILGSGAQADGTARHRVLRQPERTKWRLAS